MPRLDQFAQAFDDMGLRRDGIGADDFGAAQGYGLGNGLASSSRSYYDPSLVYDGVGFRVARVPEPTSGFLTILASGMLLIRRKR